MTEPGSSSTRRRTPPGRVGLLALGVLAGALAGGCDEGGGETRDAGNGADASTTQDASTSDGGTTEDASTEGSGAPVPDATEGPSDLTLYVDPSGNLTVYWRDASDDETDQDALEYEVSYQFTGGAENTVEAFQAATSYAREAQGRMYLAVSSGGNAQGTHTVRIRVRDEDGNESEYPALTHTVIGCQVCAIPQPPRTP